MESLRFPLFMDLIGKKCVVIGGGHVGGKRAEMLATFGANVTVIDPANPQLTEVTVVPRMGQAEDLTGAFLCVLATDCPEENRRLAEVARQAGVLVNVADDAQNCDFFFPAIYCGDGLVAGVVGTGADHKKTAQMAKKIRQVMAD